MFSPSARYAMKPNSSMHMASGIMETLGVNLQEPINMVHLLLLSEQTAPLFELLLLPKVHESRCTYWHLYPDLLVPESGTTNIRFGDLLMHPAGNWHRGASVIAMPFGVVGIPHLEPGSNAVLGRICCSQHSKHSSSYFSKLEPEFGTHFFICLFVSCVFIRYSVHFCSYGYLIHLFRMHIRMHE